MSGKNLTERTKNYYGLEGKRAWAQESPGEAHSLCRTIEEIARLVGKKRETRLAWLASVRDKCLYLLSEYLSLYLLLTIKIISF